MSAVSVIIPARDEQARIAATVRAATTLPGVAEVLVVDDGSRDDTAAVARAAGARVLPLGRGLGKAGAVRAGCRAAKGELLLLLDADLGETAARAQPLLEPVRAGEADMTVARFPERPGRGGLGLAVGLARWGVWAATGQRLQAPLSGQRALRRQLLEAVRWWGRGWGLEVALDLAALRAGYRVLEVPVDLDHRPTGRDWAGFVHRGRQFADIALTLAASAWLGRMRP